MIANPKANPVAKAVSLSPLKLMAYSIQSYQKKKKNLTGGPPRACRQYLLLSVYGVHHGPWSSSASAGRRSRTLDKKKTILALTRTGLHP